MKIGYVRLERGYMLCTLAGHLLARDGFVTRDPERHAIFSDEQAAIAEARRIARKRSARYIGEVRYPADESPAGDETRLWRVRDAPEGETMNEQPQYEFCCEECGTTKTECEVYAEDHGLDPKEVYCCE